MEFQTEVIRSTASVNSVFTGIENLQGRACYIICQATKGA